MREPRDRAMSTTPTGSNEEQSLRNNFLHRINNPCLTAGLLIVWNSSMDEEEKKNSPQT